MIQTGMRSSSQCFRLDFRWFAITVGLLSIYSFRNLIQVSIHFQAAEKPHEASFSPGTFTSWAENPTVRNSTSAATTHPAEKSPSLPNATMAASSSSTTKFFILAPPQVTSWLTENHTEKASFYYHEALNEESAEIWLHRGFERMSYGEGRTLDPSKADLFLISGYLHLNLAINKKKQPKGRKGSSKPDRSFLQLYQKLIVDPSKPHLLLVPSWNPTVSSRVGLKELGRVLSNMGVNLWSVGFERSEFWQGVPPERILPIPYIVRPSREILNTSMNSAAPRTKDFVFYAGDARRNAKGWAGCHRDKMILPLQNETTGMDVRIVKKDNRLNETEYNDRMSHSEYCLILCGDTPSSRSLTSAIVSGCIPIRVGSRLRGLCEPPCKKGYGWKVTGAENPHLPFPDQIPWEEFPEVDEEMFMESGRQVLQDLFLKYDLEKKNEIRSTMLRVQHGWIYGWGDPTNSTDFGEAVPFIWRSFKAALGLPN
jgi:hypothetical protein